MNIAILTGRLARDTELSYMPNTQTACCRFTVAVDRPKKDGQDQGADFIRIVVWGRSAEACDRYLQKGSQVAVRGRIQTGSYKNRDGQTVYTTDIVADMYNGVEFLGSPRGENSRSDGSYQQSGTNYHSRNNAPQNGDKQLGFDDLPQGFSTVDDDMPY